MWKIYICVGSLLSTNRMWCCLSISLIVLFLWRSLYLWPLLSLISVLFLFSTDSRTTQHLTWDDSLYPSLFSETRLHWRHLIPVLCVLSVWIHMVSLCTDQIKRWGKDVCSQHVYNGIIQNHSKKQVQVTFHPKTKIKK